MPFKRRIKTKTQSSKNVKRNGVLNDKKNNFNFKEAFVDVNCDNLMQPKYFDMPLLDEMLPSQHSNVSTIDSDLIYKQLNNNENLLNNKNFAQSISTLKNNIENRIESPRSIFVLKDSNGMQHRQDKQSTKERNYSSDDNDYNLIETASSASTEDTITSNLETESDDDISQFLIFHKTFSQPYDHKLKTGCFVKLIKDEVEVVQKEKQASFRKKRLKKMTKSIGQLSKKVSLCAADPAFNQERRRTESNKKREDEPNKRHDRPILAKLVGLNSKNYQYFLLETLKRKIETEEPDIANKQFHKIKKCSVLIDTLPQIESSNLSNCDKEDDFTEKQEIKTATTKTAALTDAVPTCFNDDQPLDLSMPKKIDVQMATVHTGASNCLGSIDTEKIEYKVCKPLPVQVKQNEILKISFDEIHNDKVTQTTTPIEASKKDNSTKLLQLQQCQRPESSSTNCTDFVVKSQEDSDDTCSVSSELSIFAPSLSDILNSPKTEDLSDDADDFENHAIVKNKFRIPKVDRNIPILEKQPCNASSNIEQTKSATNREIKVVPRDVELQRIYDSSIEEIFRATIRFTPKMISPIKSSKWDFESIDPPLNGKIKTNMNRISTVPKLTSHHKEVAHKNGMSQEKSRKANSKYAKPKTHFGCKDAHIKTSIDGITRIYETDAAMAPNLSETNNENLEEIFRKAGKSSTSIVSSHFRNGDQSDTKNMRENIVLKVSRESNIRKASFATEVNHSSSDVHIPIPPISLASAPSIDNAVPALQEQSQLDQNAISYPTQTVAMQNLISSLSTLHQPFESSTPKRLSPKFQKVYRHCIIELFKKPCIDFLNGDCSKNCQYNHQLPPAQEIFIQMSILPTELLVYIYNKFIVKNTLSFVKYFHIICQVYGQRKLDSKFYPLIKDCEKYEKYEYLAYIFEGLLLCGLNKSDALLKMIEQCQSCSASDIAFLQIIGSDPQCFIEVLTTYSTRLSVNPQIVNQLLHQVSDNPEVNRLKHCVGLLEQNGKIIFSIDTSILFKFFRAIDSIGDNNLRTKTLDIMSNVLVVNKQL